MDTEVRQLRRVRWAVRCAFVLGIGASLAANVLHAHHLLIDQVIAGWPPVAVFATIEAIARVPVRRRWLAGIRMAGLGFVAGIAFWVSYWHMASVAATHGENGSKYLLPLSVDGLVVVASISLVELTGQISAAEAKARAAASTAAGAVAASGAAVAPPDADVVTVGTGPPPAVDALQPLPAGQGPVAAAAAPVAAETIDPMGSGAAFSQDDEAGLGVAWGPGLARHDGSHAVDGGPPALDPDATPQQAQVVSDPPTTGALAASTDPPTAGSEVGAGVGDGPPAGAAEAVAWWRAHAPDMPVREICHRVGRSERTVRRILDGLPPSPPVDEHADDGPADAARHPGINGTTVAALADTVVTG